MSISKITDEQCSEVAAWVEANLRSTSDVIGEMDSPERVAYLKSIGGVPLDDIVKEIAVEAVVVVGGGNGGTSYKRDPSYQDVDVFWIIPGRDADIASFTPLQVIMLRAVLHARMTEVVLKQRDNLTILGSQVMGRRMDGVKLGMLGNGVIWHVPNRCAHCSESFHDGKFVVEKGVITHESCL